MDTLLEGCPWDAIDMMPVDAYEARSLEPYLISRRYPIRKNLLLKFSCEQEVF